VARIVLAVPATSAPSERVFSTLNRVVTDSRVRLNTERVEALVRLHENFRKRNTAFAAGLFRPVIVEQELGATLKKLEPAKEA